ncbi:hypothetical protein HX779_08830 [Pseudomonas sp. A4002]|uniref:hypothetical protein n=1 Tax=unclassified Pseudomonas TaxID=196821 RepID=UPI000C847CC6|nr:MULTISPECIES: hypothetical protein [unclassified Pseudomonas]AUO23264.1 hypothetical protein C0058_15230 [Pseudomonas sp. NC02]NVZ32077.1 hypothetical protein [Pseudomonas sp. A4002]NWB79321.1 hypothetical protein [Pseudomonas sp. F9001]NWD85544.1 hypothetical protein [Pseudomonas sp. K5002]
MAINIDQINAMEAWFSLRNDPDFNSATPEERYERRLALADDMKERGAIDSGEWRELTEAAVVAYADELG